MINSVKKTKKNCNLGKYAIKGGPGRPKNAENKFTNLKNAFLEAFEKTGGVDGLVEWIEKNSRNRGKFYQMITKMLPSNVEVEDGNQITYIISEEFVPKED